MATSGDEGIKEKFFGDLKRLFPENPEVDDGLVQDFENVGLNSNHSDAVSEESKFYSVEGDDGVGNTDMQYPIRPDAKDCLFFLRTGRCKFGSTCIFNHPVWTKDLVDKGRSTGNGVEGSSRKNQIPCKFYPTGFCKYGEFCRFAHFNTDADISFVQLNSLGFPMRWGKKECSFYLRTGMCGYGVDCRFHHPDPTFLFESGLYSPDVTGESLDKTKEASEITPYFPVSEVKAPECNQEISSSTVLPAENVKTSEDRPEDHPTREPCVLNNVGLPIRPGKKICWNYENLGLCKSGRACAYDHPEKHTDSSESEFPSGDKIEET